MTELRRIKAGIDYITNGKLAFIPVPKCMSSVMREVLTTHGWEWRNKPETIKFGIVRDPINRWVAGMAQTFYHLPEHVEKIRENLDPYVEKAWHDPHTSKQIWYYKDANELFRLDQLDVMQEWLQEQGVILEIPALVQSDHWTSKAKEELRKIILGSLTEKHLEKLEMFYERDIKLYHSSYKPSGMEPPV